MSPASPSETAGIGNLSSSPSFYVTWPGPLGSIDIMMNEMMREWHDGMTWWQDIMMGWLARSTRRSWAWQTIYEDHCRAIVVIGLSVVLNCFRYNHIPFSWQVAFSFIFGHLSFIICHHKSPNCRLYSGSEDWGEQLPTPWRYLMKDRSGISSTTEWGVLVLIVVKVI